MSSPIEVELVAELLHEWQWAQVHEWPAFLTRARHLISRIDEVREKEAAERRKVAAE